MKKAAIIQSGNFFTPELKDIYLQDIPLLTSYDIKEIYAFIIKKSKKNCIFKFVLNIDSGILIRLINYISLKKKYKAKSFSTIKKCTFIATRSNADYVREKNNIKGINLYFTLTTIGEILQDYSDNRIFIVSNDKSPFFDQIYSFKNTNNYRISDITVDILNQYKGNSIACALNSEDEYKTLVDLILKSNYKKILQFIEVSYLGILKPLWPLMFSFNNINAGSGILGNMLSYPQLNDFKIYENTSLMLVYQSSNWDSFIKYKIVSKNKSKYGKILTYLNENDFK